MTARKQPVRRDEPVVTTAMFTEAEREAWWVACQRELPVTAADLRAMVTAAAPLIAAAERDRICQLATELGAVYTTLDEQGYAHDGALFADRLRDEP